MVPASGCAAVDRLTWDELLNMVVPVSSSVRWESRSCLPNRVVGGTSEPAMSST